MSRGNKKARKLTHSAGPLLLLLLPCLSQTFHPLLDGCSGEPSEAQQDGGTVRRFLHHALGESIDPHPLLCGPADKLPFCASPSGREHQMEPRVLP